MNEQTETLADALPKEIERVQELIPMYMSVPMGFIAAGMMKETIKAAHRAMVAGDLVAMISAHQQLKGFEA